VGSEGLVAGTGAASELDYQALAHKVGTMEGRNDVTSVHGVLVLNEAEAIHELDLSNLASAMGLEVALDVCLGGIAGEVTQVKARRRYLGHDSGGVGEALS
jgi:hypothetical protein